MKTDADILIAGAGAAGLMLARELTRPGRARRRILIVDRAPKVTNDRTWCFWERGENTLEDVVFRRWPTLDFHSPRWSGRLKLGGYAYKMIRASDFYAAMRSALDAAGVEWAYGEIASVGDAPGGGGQIQLTDGAVLRAAQVFSSIPERAMPKAGTTHLLQHFLGWVIRTDAPAFDPGVATLMDFRVDQAGDTRFVYTLPFSASEALVEHTVFSAATLARDEYASALRAYIGEWLGLSRYSIAETEYGVIPMSDAPICARSPGGGVIRIGTAGGATKPSTGYTFRRAQTQAGRIAANLEAGRDPLAGAGFGTGRFWLYDRTLLNVLAHGRRRGADVFTDLFSRIDAESVLSFLDERPGLNRELRVMAHSQVGAFLPAALAVVVDEVRRRFQGEAR